MSNNQTSQSVSKHVHHFTSTIEQIKSKLKGVEYQEKKSRNNPIKDLS